MLSLPIDQWIPSLQEQLATSQHLVVSAAPGSGKTTRLPPALLDAVPGHILVLQPRRMAAIAAAHRIAEERGWQVGREVGYQVRFDAKVSKQTRLIFITEALLTRRLLSDPELSGVSVVILDEFHERSIHVDLGLGLLKELNELGGSIQIVVMSATLETDRVSRYLHDAPVVTVPGQLHELETHYHSLPQKLVTDHEFYQRLMQTIQHAQSQTSHDILVFLPGTAEIEQMKSYLQSRADTKQLDIVSLHGSLPLAQQQQALSMGPRQRVILSTNIAESSVTVSGVNVVIDCGLAKNMRQDPRTGFSRLELQRISLASAQQRAGRAARQWPGHCFRMWSSHEENTMAPTDVPEISRVDLAEPLHFLAAQGTRDFSQFLWYEPPAEKRIATATNQLLNLGLLTSSNGPTHVGQRCLAFPLPPSLAVLMVTAEDLGIPSLGADICALLSERDVVRKEAMAAFLSLDLECDLTARWILIQQFRESGQCHDIHRRGAESVIAAAKALRRQSRCSDRAVEDSHGEMRQLILRSFVYRLCRRRSGTDRGLMVGGRGVQLAQDSLVRKSEFFIALTGIDSARSSDTRVPLACGFSKNEILEELAGELQWTEDLFLDEAKGEFFIRRFRSIRALPIEEPVLRRPTPEEVQPLWGKWLSQRLDWVIGQNENLAHWWSRWLFFADRPQCSSEVRFTQNLLEEIFSQAAYGESELSTILSKDLTYYFQSRLDGATAQAMEKEVPGQIRVPSGSMIKVNYSKNQDPFIEVRIQEIFGWRETPKILFGEVPLKLHLLGPNFRPFQVTSDLDSFWKNGYVEARKELRGRYPKHSWPEDPWNAQPEARGRRRKN